jgi:hypothetical protein
MIENCTARGVSLVIAVAALLGLATSGGAAEGCKAVGKTRAVVSLKQPASGDIAGVSLAVDYPKGRVGIPGEREEASVKGRVRGLPTGFLSSINDDDGEIHVALASGTETFAPDARFTIEFDRCDGSQAVGAKDFSCKVESASLSCGNAVDGVSCVVSLE